MTEFASSAPPTPEAQSGAGNHISATRLNTWLACPLKFKLRYVEGIAAPPSPSLFLGKMVHAGLEHFYRCQREGRSLSPDDLAGEVRRRWDLAALAAGVRFPSPAEQEAARRQTLELLRTYLARLPKNEPQPIAVEHFLSVPLIDPFSGEDLGVPLVGVLDLVLPDAEGPLVVDFKTSARSGAPLENSHEVQLSCYALLARAAYGMPETGVEIRQLIKTKKPQVEFHRYPVRQDVHFRRLFAVIRAYLDDVNRGRFVFRPGLGCSCCDYRLDACREWLA